MPATAITWDRSGAGIWVADEGSTARVPVTIRYREGDQVWVETEAPLGAQIVAEGAVSALREENAESARVQSGLHKVARIALGYNNEDQIQGFRKRGKLLQQLKKDSLQDICDDMDLAVSGNKDELVPVALALLEADQDAEMRLPVRKINRSIERVEHPTQV